jgi:hypothetical protein
LSNLGTKFAKFPIFIIQVSVIKVPLFTNCRSFKCLSCYNRSTVRNSIFARSHQNLLIDQTCRLSIKCQMCLCIPRCLWMLINATIGFDQHSHTHTHTLSLSVSLVPCFLSPPFLTLYKLALRLCVHQLKYRFHCTRLFSFQR